MDFFVWKQDSCFGNRKMLARKQVSY